MEIVTLTGITAGVLTTLAYAPQAWKVLRTRHTADISLLTYIMINTGMVLWAVYGFWLGQWPIVIPNIVTMFFSVPILIMKIRLG